MTKTRSLLPFALLALALGCGDSTGTPPTRTDGDLTFTRAAADAPALATDSLGFWAHVGTDYEKHIYYLPRANETQGDLCLRFRVRARSLARYPDGRAFAASDSVFISIKVVDIGKQIFDFQPAGLRFSASEPADLQLKYIDRDHDFNDDGVVDATDQQIESAQLSIWRQELSGQPWVKQSSSVTTEFDEIETDIFGFTHYVIAF
jgi:hypothetical protein